MQDLKTARVVAAHLLLTASIVFAYLSFDFPSAGALIAALIIANAAPLIVRRLCLGLSHAPRDLRSNLSDLQDGPFHKHSPFIHSYPLIIVLFALFVLLLSFIRGF